MPKNFGEQQRKGNKQETSQTSEYLQGLKHNFEINQKQLEYYKRTGGRTEATDALEKQVNELMAEIDGFEPGFMKGEKSKERDRCIVENFGEKILSESETVAKSVDTIIKDHLLAVKDKKDAERILSL